MRARLVGVIVTLATLASCGGGNDPMAKLCSTEAQGRMSSQIFRLDEAKLAASKVQGSDGNFEYTGEVILKPGTSAEEMQTFDCTVAPAVGDAPARVIQFRFNYLGSSSTNG
jgi:hypothetical protein